MPMVAWIDIDKWNEEKRRIRQENIDAFYRRAAGWVGTHPGNLVLIVDGESTGFFPAVSDNGYQELLTAVEGLGMKPYLLRYIPLPGERPQGFRMRFYVGDEERPRYGGYFETRIEAEIFGRRLEKIHGVSLPACRVEIWPNDGRNEDPIMKTEEAGA